MSAKGLKTETTTLRASSSPSRPAPESRPAAANPAAATSRFIPSRNPLSRGAVGAPFVNLRAVDRRRSLLLLLRMQE